MTRPDESFDERLARIGAEAEAGDADQTDRPLPPHVKVSRPGRASVELQRQLLDLAVEAEENEVDEDDDAPIPPHVKVSRPNRRRTAADYEAASDHYETRSPTAGEIGRIELGPGYRRTAADYEAMSREIEAGQHIVIGPVESGPADSPLS